ncbi:MAG TPA: tetratricopeptide repeat protein, partial [Kofleriaceae bacterium]|nr:tetratricopeptide repeat protein [Kofleriaceae bacterium]
MAALPESSRRRLWTVGVVAVMASALVAISVVWALDASSRDAKRAADDDREQVSAPVAELATPSGLTPPPAAQPVETPEPEPAPPPPPAAVAPPPAPEPEARPVKRPAPEPAPAAERRRPPPDAPRKKPAPPLDAEPGAGAGAATAASPAQLYKEGAQLTLAGKLAEAQKKYIAALRVSPGYAPALRGLGLVYEKSGQKAKAIKSLQAYLRLAPKAADAAAIRARIERLRH